MVLLASLSHAAQKKEYAWIDYSITDATLTALHLITRLGYSHQTKYLEGIVGFLFCRDSQTGPKFAKRLDGAPKLSLRGTLNIDFGDIDSLDSMVLSYALSDFP